jgi:AcrR family transcriptional regulator
MNTFVLYFRYGALVSDADALTSLPRGPHNLSREQVSGSQRERLYRAMIEVVAEKGYGRTAVGDVLRRARISRATFYEQFADKEDCFLAAYDAAIANLVDRIRTTAARATSPGGGLRVGAVLDGYLAAIAAEPAVARTFLIEVYAAGPKALERRYAVLERFVDLLSSLLAGTPGWPPADSRELRLRCEAIVGALSSMVTTRVASDDFGSLSEIRDPVLALAGLAGLSD